MGFLNKKQNKKGSTLKKKGTPPEELVYVGNKNHVEDSKIEAISYNRLDYFEGTFDTPEEALALVREDKFTWLNVNNLTNIKEIETLGKFASINNLFLEDVLDTMHRPKIEVLNDSILVIMKGLNYVEGKINIEHLAFILGDNYLISFQETKKDVFESIHKRLKENNSMLRSKGIDYLLFSLMDVVIDNYFIILEDLTDAIEDFEDQIIDSPKEEMIGFIQNLKREAMFIRRSIYPLREVISKLEKTTHFIIKEDTSRYFKDLYEHAIHVVENLDTYRDMLLGLMDMYMSSMGNRMNSIMKVLTIMSTIFIPMTFIAGVYGMNFTNMPFLKNPYGYHITWVIMIGLAVIMLIYYKHKKWI